ncbi:MAG: hypothetical protein ACKVT0_03625 [Planctomycetaceae bacterium]
MPRFPLVDKNDLNKHVKKDLETLEWFSSSSEVSLSNKRYLGVEKELEKKYELAPNAVLCWAGVYCGPKFDFEKQCKGLENRLLFMHAVTAAGKEPSLHFSPYGEE